ncbi:GGDEF domain-containing protein [bacterium]|nr:GGDEF domain-containing protein [bacterium]
MHNNRTNALQQQAARRDWRLRFEPGLEREFNAQWVEMRAWGSGIAVFSAGLLTAAFLIADLAVLGQRLPQVVVAAIGIGVVPALLLAGLVPSQRAMRPIMGQVTLFALALSGAGFVWAFVLTRTDPMTPPYAYEAGIVFIAYAYLFSMLLFRAAVVVGWGYFLAYLAAQWASGSAATPMIYASFFLVATNIVGMAGCYMLERYQRRAWVAHAMVEELATHDALTAVLNRRGLDADLDDLWKQAFREDQALMLVMVDIDHFKQVNDRFGHAWGDSALRTVAEAMREMSRRPLDRIARYGGDEFCGIWYGTPQREGLPQLLYDEITERLTAMARQTNREPPTVSIGAASIRPRQGGNREALFRRADAALYQAKQQGRNCVVIADDDPLLA